MSRVQLALNVSNVDEAVEFYRRFFGTEPAKRRPGYANFAIADPPLKLVLIEGAGAPGSLNHVGIEVGSTGEVVTEGARLKREGFELRHEDGVTCCYAVQDKFWVSGADGREWEVYTVLADAPSSVQSAAPQPTKSAPGTCGSTTSA
jgi:catechol 2,3-dioxygenase-like lactoylglutathione lyase family enzyme